MARYNRNRNPSFDTNTSNWFTSRTTTLRRVTNYARPDGRTGCFADANTTSTSTGIIEIGSSAVALVDAGRTYTVSIYVYHSAGSTRTVSMDVDQYTLSGGYIGTWGGSGSWSVSVPHNTWTRVVQTGTTAANTVQLATYLIFDMRRSNTYIGVCCAMVEDGPTSPNYRDGNNPGWTWTGTSGLTESRNFDPVASARTVYLAPGQAVLPGEQVLLTAEYSTDAENSPLTHTWDVIDAGGTGASNQNLSGRTTAFPTFTAPAGAGTVTIRLTSTDLDGLSGTDTLTVTVAAPPGPEPGRMLLAT